MAYIDPGAAGQMITQGGSMIWIFLATMLGAIGLFFKRILYFFKAKPKVGVAVVAVAIPAIVVVAYLLFHQP